MEIDAFWASLGWGCKAPFQLAGKLLEEGEGAGPGQQEPHCLTPRAQMGTKSKRASKKRLPSDPRDTPGSAMRATSLQTELCPEGLGLRVGYGTGPPLRPEGIWMGPAGHLELEAALLPVLSGPGSATGTVQACQGQPSTGQRVGTAPFLSSAGRMSLANPFSGLTRGPTPLQDQQDRDGEGVVAIQVRHWGSRGQPHPLSQFCQPPNEAGMCMGEEELAPQLGTLKVEPPHQHTPCVGIGV